MIVRFSAYKILERYNGGYSTVHGLCVDDDSISKDIVVDNKTEFAIEASIWRDHVAAEAARRGVAYSLSAGQSPRDKSRKFSGFKPLSAAFGNEKINYAAAPFKGSDGEIDPLAA